MTVHVQVHHLHGSRRADPPGSPAPVPAAAATDTFVPFQIVAALGVVLVFAVDQDMVPDDLAVAFTHRAMTVFYQQKTISCPA